MEPIAYINLSLFLILFVNNFHHQLQVLALATSGSDHDFRYMESVYDATEMSSEEEYYDYIIIGGGTAGCPLAATLSQNYSVLVLERGSDPTSHPNVLHLSGFFANLMQEEADDNGGVAPAQRFTSEDGVENVRGRVLGGTSMINAGFFSRADEGFFSQSGVKWEMDIVEKAFEWVEKSIVFRPRLPVWQSAVKDGLLEAGVGPDNEFLLKHELGTKVSGSTFDEVGRRHGAVELLNKANLKNLRVAVRATVERIIFSTKESKPSAIGVIYSDSNGKSHTVLLRHKGEVILSAGAIGSPQLLLLSGIGPHSYLSSLHIPVVHSQPNVGDSITDNPRNNVNLVIPSPTEPSPVQVVGITNHYFIETISANLPSSLTPSPFSLYPKSSTTHHLSMAIIGEKLRQPLSSGSLWLASSTDVRVAPHVRFNYFAHPKDLSHCVTGMRKIGEVLKAKSLERFKMVDSEGERRFMYFGPSLPTNQSDESAMEEFCRSTVTTIWHYHGGSAVGKVVNGDFQVMGVSSLRVVDGSTFRLSPGTNPQATLMMLGRYVGLKMLQEREAEINAKY
ncbi:(R)-mandelonitrile lyase 1-like [Humulus lupulus]|uniref:(R)-mandelonitrile lyase 1-like n=1 Tax=Humulus lupulus TaxID=3486 RepID=UPI002B402604|nr:(R)-mandelonitrile lyase 1-like [Humulus lupulus]